MVDSVSLFDTKEKEPKNDVGKDDSFIPIIIKSIKQINLFKIILLFILFLILCSTTFIDNVLNKIPGCTELASSSVTIATNTGIVVSGLLLVFAYLLIGLIYDVLT